MRWTIVLLVMSLGASVRADDWPGWRGPNADGISREPVAPLHWGPDRNVRWKAHLPGRGHASPIVVGDRVFLVSALEEEQERLLVCLDRKTGKILWQQTVLTAPREQIHPLNSYASSTPASDGERVYVSFLDGGRMYVAAYDFAGRKVWETRPGEFHSRHGFCSCPVVHGEFVFVNGDHDGDSYIVKLEKSTGNVVLKIPREHKTRSYSTPIFVPIDGREQLLITGSLVTAGFDPLTGERIWVCDGPSEQMVATMVHNRELLFALGGFPERHLLAIRKGGKGDVTGSHVVWRTHKAVPYVPSPLLYGELLHVVSDEGIYTCYDPATGKIHARKRVARHISSSLVGACDRVYITDDDGTTVVLQNSPDYVVLAENSIGEEVYSTCAIANGDLFLRGSAHLFCIGGTPSRQQAAAGESQRRATSVTLPPRKKVFVRNPLKTQRQ